MNRKTPAADTGWLQHVLLSVIVVLILAYAMLTANLLVGTLAAAVLVGCYFLITLLVEFVYEKHHTGSPKAYIVSWLVISRSTKSPRSRPYSLACWTIT